MSERHNAVSKAFILVSALVMAGCIAFTLLQLLDAQRVFKISPWAWWTIARVFCCVCIVQAVLCVALILSPLFHLLTGGWAAAVSANSAAWSVLRFVLILEIAVAALSWSGLFRICGSEDEYRSEECPVRSELAPASVR